MNGKDTKGTECLTDVKPFSLAYKFQITTKLGLSPYGMVFNQKPHKTIIFTANSSKKAQYYCQPTKDTVRYNLPLHINFTIHTF